MIGKFEFLFESSAENANALLQLQLFIL